MKKTFVLKSIIIFIICCGESKEKRKEWTYYESGEKKSVQVLEFGKDDEGLFTEWYENGEKKSEGKFKDGKQDGLWTYWNEDARKKSEGSYIVGKRNGLWTYWNEDGLKNYKQTFKWGELVDEWTFVHEFYDNGQQKGEGTLKDGKQDGLWIMWYENGKKEYEGTYRDGKRDGLWTKLYENGLKEFEGVLKDGKRDGLWTRWYENGQKINERTYKNGEQITSSFWNVDGSVQEPINFQINLTKGDNSNEYYTKDTNEPYSGPVFSLNNNELKESEGVLKDGKKVGLWTYWDEYGRKSLQSTYKNGELVDEWTFVYEYHEDGRKKSEGKFKDGKEDGLWTYWAKNDDKIEGNFSEGKKVGLWTYWAMPAGSNNNSSPRKNKEENYKNGKLHGLYREWWNYRHVSTGRIKEGTFNNGEKDGLWVTWYVQKDEQKRYEENYKDGLLDGKWASWGEVGWLEEEGTYKNGKKVHWIKYQYSSRKKQNEANYKDGILDGLYTVWHDGLTIKSKEGTYKSNGFKGLKDGLWTEWHNYENYGEWVSAKITYVDGEIIDQHKFIMKENKQNEYVDYSLNEVGWTHLTKGIPQKDRYFGNLIPVNNSKRYGLWTLYSGRKTKRAEVIYKDDQKYYPDQERFLSKAWDNKGVLTIEDGNGLWIEKYHTGEKKSAVTYKDGKRIGKKIFYNRDGSVKR